MMKKYDFRPLLFMIPLILVLIILIFIEGPARKKHGSLEKTESDTSKKDQSNSMLEEGVSDRKGADRDYSGPDNIRVDLVIGTVGSVRDGGYAEIYELMDEESEVVGKLQFNCAVRLIDDIDDDWYCVDVDAEGTEAYVRKENARTIELSIGCNDPVRDRIVKDAYEYLGLHFVRYGKSLETGIDCSNYIQKIYALSDLSIPDEPLAQMRAGTRIEEEDALPGDLVFYDKANDGYGHVAIYLGEGMMINSSGHSGQVYPRGGVRICCLKYKDRGSYQLYDLIDSVGENIDMDQEETTLENEGIQDEK